MIWTRIDKSSLEGTTKWRIVKIYSQVWNISSQALKNKQPSIQCKNIK